MSRVGSPKGVPVRSELDVHAIRGWVARSVDALAGRREEINALNVFPVADSDTGTNLHATMRSALGELLHTETPDAPAALRALASGALHGARGNSGMLLSQVLRGMSEADLSAGGAAVLHPGLTRAGEYAWAALSAPEAGTMLSVLDAAAAAARDAAAAPSHRAAPAEALEAALEAALDAGQNALWATTWQLEALRAAGVVDAGAVGLLVVLGQLRESDPTRHNGREGYPEIPVPSEVPAAGPVPEDPQGRQAPPQPGASAGGAGRPSTFQYEVMYLLTGCTAEDAQRLRDRLARLGDCVSVISAAGGSEHDAAAAPHQVHVHCDDIGAALEAAIELGRPRRISVERFADQAGTGVGGTAGTGSECAPQRSRLAMVLSRDPALGELARAAGAQLWQVGQGATPGTPADAGELDPERLAQLLAEHAADEVLALLGEHPAPETVAALTERAARMGRSMLVVPTASPVQVLAALAVHNPRLPFAEDAVAMTEAAAATRYGEVRQAQEDALTWAGRCSAGDLLGLIDGEVSLIAQDPVAACCELADRMLSVAGELVTVLLGAGAPAEAERRIRDHLHRQHPEVEIAVFECGLAQPMLLGVE